MIIKRVSILCLLLLIFSCEKSPDYHVLSEVPDLTMPTNHLQFKQIEDYKNYKIVGTHFRTDKNELRYILANKTAFKAYTEGGLFQEGSIIVKIGWNVEKMSNFGAALEAKEVQRVEYMFKDAKQFPKNPGNWGYARFVKNNGVYKSWNKGTQSCISCHNLAKDNDNLFTKFQKLE